VGGFGTTNKRKVELVLKSYIQGFVSFKILRSKQNSSKGCGYLTVKTEEDVERCLTLAISIPVTPTEAAAGKQPKKLKFALPKSKETRNK
jgi:hypothetical protein